MKIKYCFYSAALNRYKLYYMPTYIYLNIYIVLPNTQIKKKPYIPTFALWPMGILRSLDKEMRMGVLNFKETEDHFFS